MARASNSPQLTLDRTLIAKGGTVAKWPVLDGDPRWEEKLDKQMRRMRTRLQKRLSTATGEKKASLVAQLKALKG